MTVEVMNSPKFEVGSHVESSFSSCVTNETRDIVLIVASRQADECRPEMYFRI